jgi:hypothetical protein
MSEAKKSDLEEVLDRVLQPYINGIDLGQSLAQESFILLKTVDGKIVRTEISKEEFYNYPQSDKEGV